MGHLKKKKKKKFREATTDERRQKRTCIGAKHGAKEFFFITLRGDGVLAGLVKNTICIELSSL